MTFPEHPDIHFLRQQPTTQLAPQAQAEPIKPHCLTNDGDKAYQHLKYNIKHTMSLANIARTCQRGLSRRIATTKPSIPRRFMGGGGGGQPISRSMEAELFGGHPKREGWETATFITYGCSAVLLVMATGLAPDTTIKTVSLMFCK